MNSWQEVDVFNQFIKPVRHSILTPFCKQLTTITQNDVDKASLFEDVMAALNEWLLPYEGDFIFCSWGNYDKNHIVSDCNFFSVENPLQGHHLNLKSAFAKKQGVKRCGLHRALTIAGLRLKGQHHRGIDDAHNIARLLDFCFLPNT